MKVVFGATMALFALSTQTQARVLSNNHGVVCVIGTFIPPHGMELSGKGGWDIGDRKSHFSNSQEPFVQTCMNYSIGKDTPTKGMVSVPYSTEFFGNDPTRFGVLACVKGGGALRFDKVINPKGNFRYQFKESEFVQDGPAIRKYCH